MTRRRTSFLRRGRPILLGLAIVVVAVVASAQAPGSSLDPDLPFRKYVIDTWRLEDGLPSAMIRAIHQTRDGYLWLGTRGGLARFDGARFTVFDRTRVPGFLGNNVATLAEGRDGSLWVGFYQGGLHRLRDGEWDHFDTRHGLSHNTVTALHESVDSHLWIVTRLGVDRFDGESFTSLAGCPERAVGIAEPVGKPPWILARKGFLRVEGTTCVPVSTGAFPPDLAPDDGWTWHFAARDGAQWLVAESGRVFRLDGETLTRVGADEGRGADFRVRRLFEDRRGTLWGASAQGLTRFAGGVATTFTPQEGLTDRRVISFFEDREGSLWIGTYTGLQRLKRSQFETFTVADGLSDDNVFTVFEGKGGVVWIGSDTGVDRYSGGVLESVPTVDGRPLDSVRSLLEDSRGRLWAGTRDGLFRLDQGVLKRYEEHPTLVHAEVRTLNERRSSGIWVGVPGPSIPPDEDAMVEIVATDDVYAIGRFSRVIESRQGGLWIAAWNALYRLRGGSLTRYPSAEDSQTYLIRDIREDPSGVLWLGSFDSGLLRFEDGRFTEVNTSHGLHDDHVWYSAEDDEGVLWMCSDRGIFTAARREIDELARGERTSISSVSYDLADGLKSLECNGFGQPGGLKASDGRIWFMTAGGVVIVDPARLERNLSVPAVHIEEVEVDAVDVEQAELLVVPTAARQLQIRFTATSLRDASRVRFRYRLEGYDDDWTETSRRWAVYGNLPPGSYTFRVKGSNNNGLWNEEGASLAFLVPPPWWRTWWAYTLYILATAAVVAGTLQVIRRERAVNRRLRAVDKLKDEFLANTSHELRTPLYGITGIVESLIDGATGELGAETKENLAMVVASGRRLSHLVDDVLDFSKLRHRSLELDRRAVDLRALVDVVLTLSGSLVGSKDVRLINAVPADLPPADADEDRLQQILYNLIGNAIKFTEEGHVEVSAAREGERLVVGVTDTGIGIPEEKQQRIFDAFEQADASVEREYGGTGLGLAVSRQLVELHGSAIGLESTPGKGSIFSFSLEVAAAAVSSVDVPAGDRAEEKSRPPAEAHPIFVGDESPTVPPALSAETAAGAPRVLVVDDEPVNLQVVRNYLAVEEFDLTLASSGEQALRLLKEESFDLVLLDVMMPKISGYEVCRGLRKEHSISDLPVIFLTAKTRDSDVVAGMALGANDYLTKPITRDRLLARVRPHLDLLHVHRNLEDLVEEKMSEVKVLSGLLPICSGCKKIRDDEGYWSQLELFIDVHSEAEFSHGICPDCLERFYGEHTELRQGESS